MLPGDAGTSVNSCCGFDSSAPPPPPIVILQLASGSAARLKFRVDRLDLEPWACGYFCVHDAPRGSPEATE